MANEQIVETKKWNKLSVGVFVLTLSIYGPAVLAFLLSLFFSLFSGRFIVEDIPFLISNALSRVAWPLREEQFSILVILLVVLLPIFSIFSLVQAKKQNQKGSSLSLVSLVLFLFFIGFYVADNIFCLTCIIEHPVPNILF
jgi:preprotein translocase subunit SecE